MGKEFKLPKFEMPNFSEKAEKKVLNYVNSKIIPDFSQKATDKIEEIQKQIENPDEEKINALFEKLDTAKSISKVANALGINIEEDKVRNAIQKKNDLESALASKAYSSVEKFMNKQGYPIDSSEKMLSNVSNRLMKGDEPTEIIKDTAKPFSDMIRDNFNGNNTNNTRLFSEIENDARANISNKVNAIISSEKTEEKIEQTSKLLNDKISEIKGIDIPQAPDISLESTEKKVKDIFKINNNIPDNIKKLMEKYDINLGGN